MPTFLTTKGISFEIERIISRANKFLLLLTYNFKLNDDYIKRIERATKRNVKVKILHNQGKIDENNFYQLSQNESITILSSDRLHAKLYVNEKELVLTSMNLSDHSEKNNIELGLHITKDNEPELFDEICKEGVEIFRNINENREQSQAKKHEIRESSSNNIGRKIIYTNHGKEWTPEEVTQLKQLLGEGKDYKGIAKILLRKPNAIYHRVKDLNLL